VHVSDPAGQPPPDAEGWGYQEFAGFRDKTGNEEITWRPMGNWAGWVDGDDLFVEQHAAYRAAGMMATGGEGVSISLATLKRRLRERGHLKSVDEPRQTLTIRKRFGGKDLHVLHLYRYGPFERNPSLSQEPAKPANDNAEPANVGGFEADIGGLKGKTREALSVENANKHKDNSADEVPFGGFGGFFDPTIPPAPRCGHCGNQVRPPLIEGDPCQDCQPAGREPGEVT
jgi:hypothetical protein